MGSELGWEVEDTIKQLWDCRVLKIKPKNPIGTWIFLGMHHLSQFLCVIPMNLYFKDEPLYHEMVLNLQLGGALAGFLSTATWLLDMSIPAQYRLVQLLRLV